MRGTPILVGSLFLAGILFALGARGCATRQAPPSASTATTVVRVNLLTGQETPWIKVPGELGKMALSPDGHEFATISIPSQADAKTAWLLFWQYPEGKFLRQISLPGLPSGLAWLDDQRVLLGGGSDPIQVMDAHSGNVIQELPPVRIGPKPHPTRPWVATLLPDRERGTGKVTLGVFNALSGRLEFKTTVANSGPGQCVGWVPGGKHLFFADGKRASLWSTADWKPAGTWTASQLESGQAKAFDPSFANILVYQIQALAWQSQEIQATPDGRWVLRQGPGDVNSNTIELVDTKTRTMARIWECAIWSEPAVFGPSGDTLLLPESVLDPKKQSLGTIRMEDGKHWQGHSGAVSSLDVDPQGRWVVSGGQDWKIHLWDAASGKRLTTLEGSPAWIETVRISSDGAWIASRSEGEAKIRIWDVSSGRTIRWLEAPKRNGFDHFRFHPTRPWLLIPSPDGLVVWDVTTGEAIRTLTQAPTSDRDMAFSPDGALVAVLDKNGVCLLDATSFQARFTLPTPPLPVPKPAAEEGPGYTPEFHPFQRGHLVFSPDGARLWWSSPWTDGGYLGWGAIWDVSSQQLLESGESCAESDHPSTKPFPLRRDPYSDQHVGTPDGRLKIHGEGFESGC